MSPTAQHPPSTHCPPASYLGACHPTTSPYGSPRLLARTPDAMRGRVSAVHMLFVGTSNEFGDFRAGVVAAWLGALPAVMAGGICTLVVTALWARVFPELRRVDRLAEVTSGGGAKRE